MAGCPQDVAQRHAQDALVASSHRFCVLLGAGRGGHFVNGLCAFRAHTTDMCGFVQLLAGLSIKRWVPLDTLSWCWRAVINPYESVALPVDPALHFG